MLNPDTAHLLLT